MAQSTTLDAPSADTWVPIEENTPKAKADEWVPIEENTAAAPTDLGAAFKATDYHSTAGLNDEQLAKRKSLYTPETQKAMAPAFEALQKSAFGGGVFDPNTPDNAFNDAHMMNAPLVRTSGVLANYGAPADPADDEEAKHRANYTALRDTFAKDFHFTPEQADRYIRDHIVQSHQTQAEGALASFARPLATKVAPAIGTAVGGVVGGALAGLAGIETGPGAIATAVAGDIAGGAAGGSSVHALQKYIMGDAWDSQNEAQMQADAEAHPTASMFGNTVPFLISVLGGGGAAAKAAGASAAKAAEKAGADTVEQLAAKSASTAAPKLAARMFDAAATGARSGASEGAQEKYVEGKDVSVMDSAARGAATFAVTGVLPGAKELGAIGFFPAAKQILWESTKRGVTDGAAMQLAGDMYDSSLHGKPVDWNKTADAMGGSIPAFVLQNAVMGVLHQKAAFRSPKLEAARELIAGKSEAAPLVTGEAEKTIAKAEQERSVAIARLRELNAIPEREKTPEQIQEFNTLFDQHIDAAEENPPAASVTGVDGKPILPNVVDPGSGLTMDSDFQNNEQAALAGGQSPPAETPAPPNETPILETPATDIPAPPVAEPPQEAVPTGVPEERVQPPSGEPAVAGTGEIGTFRGVLKGDGQDTGTGVNPNYVSAPKAGEAVRAGNVTGEDVNAGEAVPILEKHDKNDFPDGAMGFSADERASLDAAKSSGKITIYRAVVKGQSISHGDFVTLKKSDAEQYLGKPGVEVISQDVDVGDVDYVEGTGMWPIRYKFQGRRKGQSKPEAPKVPPVEASKPAAVAGTGEVVRSLAETPALPTADAEMRNSGGVQPQPPAPIAATTVGDRAGKAELMNGYQWMNQGRIQTRLSNPPPEVASPTPQESVSISTPTLDGPKTVKGKKYLLPGYRGPDLVVSETKAKGKTTYWVRMREGGMLLESSNGVGTLENTLKIAVSRINSWTKQTGKTPWEMEHASKISLALSERKPVLAESLKAYGLRVPKGYEERGDLYTYQSTDAPNPQRLESTPAEAPQPGTAEAGDVGTGNPPDGAKGAAESDVPVQVNPDGSFTIDGRKAQQVTRGGKPIWKVQTEENRQKEQRGERQIGGDRLFDTKEEAISETQDEIRRDREFNDLRVKAEAEKAAAEAEKAAADAKETERLKHLTAYTEGMKPMQRGKVEKVLRGNWFKRNSATGKEYIGEKFSLVPEMIADGYRPVQDDGKYRFEREDGSGFDIGKTEFEYAQWAHENELDKAPAAETPEAPKQDTPAITRDATVPAQMTPEEFRAVEPQAKGDVHTSKKAAEDYISAWKEMATSREDYSENLSKAADMGVSVDKLLEPRKTTKGWVAAQTHEQLLVADVIKQKPVSAEAVDAYGIKLPEGYVRHGDLYVHESTLPKGGDSGSMKVRDRNQFPGSDYLVPPNVIAFQPRGLDTEPLTDRVFTFPYDGTAADAAKVGASAFKQLSSQFPEMSQRESVVIGSGDDGMAQHRLAFDAIHDRVKVTTLGKDGKALEDPQTPKEKEFTDEIKTHLKGDWDKLSASERETRIHQFVKDRLAKLGARDHPGVGGKLLQLGDGLRISVELPDSEGDLRRGVSERGSRQDQGTGEAEGNNRRADGPPTQESIRTGGRTPGNNADGNRPGGADIRGVKSGNRVSVDPTTGRVTAKLVDFSEITGIRSEEDALTRAAKIVEEEIIHAAHAASTVRRLGSQTDYHEAEKNERAKLFKDIARFGNTKAEKDAVREAVLASIFTYRGEQMTFEQARESDIPAMVKDLSPGQQANVAGELLRQVVQLRKSGQITEHSAQTLLKKVTDWFKSYLGVLKTVAARPLSLGATFEREVAATEAALKMPKEPTEVTTPAPTDSSVPEEKAPDSTLNEITRDLPEKPTQEDFDNWRVKNPEKYQELKEMREKSLDAAGFTISAKHGTPTKERFSEFGNRGGLTKAKSAMKAFFFSNTKSLTDTYRMQNRPEPDRREIEKWINSVPDNQLSFITPRNLRGITKSLGPEVLREDLIDAAATDYVNEPGEDIHYAVDDIVAMAKAHKVPFPETLDPDSIGSTHDVRLKMDNPMKFTNDDVETLGMAGVVQKAIDEGYDGIVSTDYVPDSFSGWDNKKPPSGIIYAVFDPAQIRFTEPLATGADGKLIGLDQRGNTNTSPPPPPEPPKPETPAPAPSPEEDQGVSNKEDAVNAEREARGLDPVPKTDAISDQETLDHARSVLAANPHAADEIVDRLKRSDDQSRTISLQDSGVMVAARRSLADQRDAAAVRAADLSLDEGQREAAKKTYDEVDAKILAMDEAAQGARSTWGRFGQFWQQMLKKDYSFDTQRLKEMRLKGRPLTEEETVHLKEAVDAHAEKVKELEQLRGENEKLNMDVEQKTAENTALAEHNAELKAQRAELLARAEEAEKDAKRGGQPLKPSARKKVSEYLRVNAEAALARIEKRKADLNKQLSGESDETKLHSFLAPEDLADYAIVLAHKLDVQAIKLEDFTHKAVKQFGEMIREHAPEILTRARKIREDALIAAFKEDRDTAGEIKAIKEGIAARLEEGDNLDDLGRYAKALHKSLVAGGMTDFYKIKEAIHSELKSIPGLEGTTEAQALKAWSNYGDFKRIDKDAPDYNLKRVLAQTHQSALEDSKRLDYERGEPAKVTGAQRHGPDETTRDIKRGNRILQRDNDIQPIDLDAHQKSALTAIKTRLKNEIADMTWAMSKEKRLLGKKTSAEYDAEAKERKVQRDAKKKEYKAAFPDEPLTPEEELARATKLAERNAERSADELAKAKLGEFKKERGEPITSPTIKDLRERAEADREQVRNLRDIARAKDPAVFDAEQAKAIEDLEKRVKETQDEIVARKNGTFTPDAAKEKDPNSLAERVKNDEAVKAKQVELSTLKGQLRELRRQQAEPKPTDITRALQNRYSNSLKRIDELNRRLAEKDYSPKRAPKVEPVPETPEQKDLATKIDAATIEKNKIEQNLIAERKAWEKSQRNWFDKGMSGLAGFTRFNVLGHLSVLEHLAGAALENKITRPMFSATAQLFRFNKTLDAIRKKAVYNGALTWGGEMAEAKSILNSYKPLLEKLRTGKSSIDWLHGDGKLYPKSWMDLTGNIHAMIKEPIRQGIFGRALHLGIKAAEEQGLNPHKNIELLRAIQQDAYDTANADIFVGHNFLTKSMHSAVTAYLKNQKTDVGLAHFTANVLDILLPVVNVPTNIAIRKFRMLAGIPESAIRLGIAAKRGELANGAEKLSRRDAELITKTFSYGLVGAALGVYAWTHANQFGGVALPGANTAKNKDHPELKPGDIAVPGIGHISHHFAHGPMGGFMNMVADAKRYFDEKKAKNPDTPVDNAAEIGAFMAASAFNNLPMTNTIGRLSSPYKTPGQKAGELVKNMFVNGALMDIAAKQNPDADPKTFMETLKSGIPYATNSVPVSLRKRNARTLLERLEH